MFCLLNSGGGFKNKGCTWRLLYTRKWCIILITCVVVLAWILWFTWGFPSFPHACFSPSGYSLITRVHDDVIHVESTHLSTYLETALLSFFMWFSLKSSSSVHSWSASLVSRQWRRGMLWCLSERETFCACVVLSQLFFLLLDTPCHVRHAEKMQVMGSSWLIRHLTLRPLFHPPVFSLRHHDMLTIPPLLSESRVSCFLCTVAPWRERRHSAMCDRVDLLMWLFSLSGDCHVFSQPFTCFS